MTEPLTATEVREMHRWVHAVVHLRARKGAGPLSEGEWVAECWMPGTAPVWAVESAVSGAPGSAWCPVLSPHLGEIAQVQDS